MRNFLFGDITEKRTSTISLLGPKLQADVLEKKLDELEKANGIVKNTRCALYCSMLKNWLSLPKLLYFLRTSLCFNHPALSEKCNKTVRDALSKVGKVNIEDFRVLSWPCLLKWMFLGFHPHPYKQFLPFWPHLFLRVTFSRRCSRKLSKMFHVQKHLRNCWVWRMNKIVLWMEPRKTDTSCSSQNRQKIDF